MVTPNMSVFLLLIVCTLAFGYEEDLEIPYQNPSEIFHSGNIPHILENLIKINFSEKTLKNYKAKQNQETLTVAVVDSGVDYYNSSIENRMKVHWDSNNENIIGIGKDLVSNNDWGHPNYINPNLFAFGADSIDLNSQKIVGEVDNPLQLIDILNNKFMDLFLLKLKNKKRLRDSIWVDKINKQSFNIFSAYYLLHSQECLELMNDYDFSYSLRHSAILDNKTRLKILKYINNKKEISYIGDENFDLEKYENFDNIQKTEIMQEKEKGKGGYLSILFNKKFMNLPDEYKTDLFVRHYYDNIWKLTEDDILPSFSQVSPLEALMRTPHFELFYDLVRNTFLEFDNEYNFGQKVLTYIKYQNNLNENYAEESLIKKNIPQDPFILELNRFYLLYKNQYDTNSSDLFSVVANIFCDRLDRETYLKLSSDNFSNEYKNKIVLQKLNDLIFSKIESIDNFYSTYDGIKKVEQIQTKDRIKRNNYREVEEINEENNERTINKKDGMIDLIQSFILERGEESFYCKHKNEGNPLYKEYFDKFSNPYMANKKDNSHGTHVAGLVAMEHKNIDIYPIRIHLDVPTINNNRIKKIREDFLVDFEKWIRNNPSVINQIYDDVKNTNYFLGYSLKSNSTDFVDRFIDKFQEIYSFEVIKISRQAFYCLNDLIESIKIIGQNKIKIANLSLGGEIESQSSQNKNSLETLEHKMSIIIFRYYQNKIFQTVKKYAPHTIFFVAAGNDGNWIDNKARINVPCDIIINSFGQSTKKRPTSNNNQLNFVCVGSLNEENKLSSYSNVLLSGAPFALALGEDVRSSVQKFDCQGIEQKFERTYGEFVDYPLFSLNSKATKDFIKSEIRKNSTKNSDLLEKELEFLSEEYVDQEIEKYQFAIDMITALEKSILREKCVHAPNTPARHSGTSMSSPKFAGSFAKWLIEKAKTQNIQLSQIYDHEDYKTSDLIKEYLKILPNLTIFLTPEGDPINIPSLQKSNSYHHLLEMNQE